MKKTETQLLVAIAEIKTDLEWIRKGVDTMHDKQDYTNGRINRLEENSKNFVTKEICNKSHEKIRMESTQLTIARMDTKGRIQIALISAASSLIVALLALAAAHFFKVQI